ncbi:MAG: MATE family efflux transporter [Planctomycetota bacterium]|nr:MATE family efflux transporter [Planctomycetota bacterium]
MVDRKAELRDKSIGKLLVKYSIPAIVGMLANSLYNVVDTMFIGQGAGTKALAALAVCFPIQIFTLAMGLFVGIGAASIVSRRLGAGDEETANRTAGTALTTSVILGLILLVVAMIFMDPVLKLFGATPEILPLGREYLTWVMLGSPFFAFTVASNQLVRSEGNMRLSMFTMILGSVVNAGIDPILIFDWVPGSG